MRRTILITYLVMASSFALGEEVRLSESSVLSFRPHPGGPYVIDISHEAGALPSARLTHEAENPKDDISINLHLTKIGSVEELEETFQVTLLTKYCELYVDSSVEKKISVQRYKSKAAEVFYCSFTDPTLVDAQTERGKFKNAIAALAISGDYEFTALGMLNGLGGENEKVFLQTVSSFRIQDGT